jgi:predicted transcriptional regulator
MMPNNVFLEKINEIKKNETELKISPRELVNAFGFERRTPGNRSVINKYLQDNQLEVEPDFTNAWVDGVVTLRHKKRAKTKQYKDPIQRVKIIPAANKEPVVVKRDALLKEATTLMRMHSYSQLPVVSGPRQIVGYISWETIGVGMSNGVVSDKVASFIAKDVSILDYETPLLTAIKVVIV